MRLKELDKLAYGLGLFKKPSQKGKYKFIDDKTTLKCKCCFEKDAEISDYKVGDICRECETIIKYKKKAVNKNKN